MKQTLAMLTVGLITTVVGVILGWYLSSVYERPKIEWYSRPYYKIDDIAIGNIFLTNTGRITDNNITITLDSSIRDSDIKIVDLTSPYHIQHNDNKTSIVIDELKPEESADITFKDDPKKDDIFITDFISKYSNIEEVPFALKPEWWNLPLWLEAVIALILVLIGVLLGYLFTKNKVKIRLKR